LPPGFCATVFADKLGHARHMTVSGNRVVYVNTWSGLYYGNYKPPPGGFLVALKDTDGDGKADVVSRFGDTAAQGSAGGTGIAIYNGALYAEVNDRIVRYRLPETGAMPTDPPETIVSGLPLTGDHPMHPFAINDKGEMFVDVATATNSCQKKNRMPKSPGLKPCKELETRGGIWRYDANKTGQKFSAAERYATGIRNADGIAVDPQDQSLYATQHGRDELSENWPNLYKPKQGAELPAEELLRVEQGADYGWPDCYFDGAQKSSCSLLNMAATAAKRSAFAPRRSRPLPGFRRTGRLTICSSIAATASPRLIAAAHSSLSTAHGTEPRSRKAAITSCFSRPPAGRLPATTWSLPMALPGRRRSREKQPIGLLASPRGRTDHSIFPTTRRDGSGV
jgi:glucose/arabinose dehydrogenase